MDRSSLKPLPAQSNMMFKTCAFLWYIEPDKESEASYCWDDSFTPLRDKCPDDSLTTSCDSLCEVTATTALDLFPRSSIYVLD